MSLKKKGIIAPKLELTTNTILTSQSSSSTKFLVSRSRSPAIDNFYGPKYVVSNPQKFTKEIKFRRQQPVCHSKKRQNLR